MHPLYLLTDIPTPKLNQLEKKGISSIEELASFFPRKYKDFRNITPIKELKEKEAFMVYGTIIRKNEGAKNYTLEIKDENGTIMQITWFHVDYIYKKFNIGDKGYFGGSVNSFNYKWVITNPQIATTDKSKALSIYPSYSKIKGMSDEYLKKCIDSAIFYLKSSPEDLEKTVFTSELNIMSYIDALNEIHSPSDIKLLKKARERVDYELLWDFYKKLSTQNSTSLSKGINPIKNFDKTSDFIKTLPFPLTDGQESALKSINKILASGDRLNTLVSGDVGCGKTIIAVIISVLMAENGYQTALLAPTLVLANQHLKEFEKFTKGLLINGKPLKIGFISGKTTKRDRTKIQKELISGDVQILLGTHAIISDEIEYNNLGMLIVDEEHKFGVSQKTKINNKGNSGVHYMAMTATPIPRSIAMSLYGENNSLISIKTKPSGRKPIITKQCFSHEEAFSEIVKEIEKGHQAYIIAPLIEKSDCESMAGVLSVSEVEAMILRYFHQSPPKKRPTIATINGKMSEAEISKNINDFESHYVDILISTTIVEVGVNVPNATAICIMSAGRFGLAGLHQLRGRVGRNNLQSYCLLCESKESERLDIICNTNDGFEIAEADLSLRGPGDLTGDEQKGISDVINIVIKRPNLTQAIRNHFQKK